MNPLGYNRNKNFLLLLVYSLGLINILTVRSAPLFLIYLLGVFRLVGFLISVSYYILINAKVEKMLLNGTLSMELEAFIKFLKISTFYQVLGVIGFLSYFVLQSSFKSSVIMIIIHIGFLYQKCRIHNADSILANSFKEKLFQT